MAAVQREPTLRSRWLGQQLREMRDQKRLTLKQVAEYTQRDASSLSRMEAGIHPARIPDVLAYLEMCEVDDDHLRKGLIQLAKDARETGWWEEYSGQPENLTDRMWLESRAVEIKSFEAIVVPGHLQTQRYAASVIRQADFDVPAEVVNLYVELRMQRQERIDSNKNLFIDVILDESVLHRLVGGREVMFEQLDHLLERSNRSDTRISILPWSAGAHSAADGCFDVIKLENPYPPAIGYVPSANGARFVENKEAIERLTWRFDRLAQKAYKKPETQRTILAVKRKLAK